MQSIYIVGGIQVKWENEIGNTYCATGLTYVKVVLVSKIYHIYNTGIDKREIFGSPEEFEKFEELLSGYLLEYVQDDGGIYKGLRPYRIRHKKEMNLAGKVILIAYSLAADRYHLLLDESDPGAVTKLMRRVITFYSMIYNRKRKRHGPVFEGAFKSVEIVERAEIPQISKTIHLDPVVKSVRRFGLVETVSGSRLDEYLYSSYRDYVSGKKRAWINPESGLGGMSPGGYANFVRDNKV